MKRFFHAILIGCCFSHPSFADGQAKEVSTGNTLYHGLYAALDLGMSKASANGDYPLLSGGFSSGDVDLGTGRAYGIAFGYNHRNGPYVYGAEVRFINLGHLTEKDPSRKETPEITAVLDLRGRFGYVNNEWMYYGALGWSRANYRIHPGDAFGGVDNTAGLKGFNVGIGAEYSFNDSWLAGIDYTYRDIDGGFGDSGLSSDADLSTLTLRLAYQF